MALELLRGAAPPGECSYLPDETADRKSGSAGMPRPISYAVFCLKKKHPTAAGGLQAHVHGEGRAQCAARDRCAPCVRSSVSLRLSLGSPLRRLLLVFFF